MKTTQMTKFQTFQFLLLLGLWIIAIVAFLSGQLTVDSTPTLQTAVASTSEDLSIDSVYVTTAHWQLSIDTNPAYRLTLRVDSTLDNVGCDGQDLTDIHGFTCILANNDDIISLLDTQGIHISDE